MNLSTIQNQQRIIFVAIIIGLGFVIAIIVYLVMAPSTQAPNKTSGIKKDPLVTGMSRLKPQEVWVHKMAQDNEATNKRLEALEDSFAKMIKLVEGTFVEQLKADQNAPLTSEKPTQTNLEPLPPTSNQLPVLPPLSLNTAEANPSIPLGYGKLQRISLSLRNPKNTNPLKTVANTIPAGTFVEAILLGGVDASTSIQASSDPRPVLLKLVDLGHLPRKFRSDLKGCHALGAVYGDIASERVFMRLEKLTCVKRNTGEIIELEVQGYIAGEDGRAGVRGTVVDRTGDSMRNAMLGGFVSGMGQYFSQAPNPVTFSPVSGLAQTNPLSLTQAFQQGAAKGASNALERYAEFYIKRAEQMQPVLQVAAGRKVDIVFTKSAAIDGTPFKDNSDRGQGEFS